MFLLDGLAKWAPQSGEGWVCTWADRMEGLRLGRGLFQATTINLQHHRTQTLDLAFLPEVSFHSTLQTFSMRQYFPTAVHNIEPMCNHIDIRSTRAEHLVRRLVRVSMQEGFAAEILPVIFNVKPQTTSAMRYSWRQKKVQGKVGLHALLSFYARMCKAW